MKRRVSLVQSEQQSRFCLYSGGVMLVHDIRKNESRIIDFRETAPSGLREEMLQDLEQKVNMLSEYKGVITPVIQFTEAKCR